jgi:hypothetical protein
VAQPPSFTGGQGPQVGRLPVPGNPAAELVAGTGALASAVDRAAAERRQTDERVRESDLQVARIERERMLQSRSGEIAAQLATEQGSLTTDLLKARETAAPGAEGYEQIVEDRIAKFRDTAAASIGSDPELVGRFADNVAAIAATARAGETEWTLKQRAEKRVTDYDALDNAVGSNIRTAVMNGTASAQTLADARALREKAINALPVDGTAKEKMKASGWIADNVTAMQALIDRDPHAALDQIDQGALGMVPDKAVDSLRESARVAADRIDNQLEQQANAAAATARAEAHNLIEDVNGATIVKPEQLQSYRAQFAGSAKPEDVALVHDLDAALAKNAVTAKYDSSSQAERIAAVHEIEGTRGWQENNQLRVAHDQLLSLIGRDDHAADSDRVSLYARQTGQALPPLNLGDPAAMRQRFIVGDEAARRYGKAPQHFTEAEARDLRTQYNQASAEGKADFLLGLGNYGSGRAREMMFQIAPAKPELIRLAELSAAADPAVRSAVREASDGAAVPMKEGIAARIRYTAQKDYGAALARLPGDRASAIAQVATWIYAHRAAAAGKADRVDDALIRQSIAAALGGTGAKGGFGRRNGAAVVLPMGSTQDDFDRLFMLARPEDFRAAANGVPKWSNTRDLSEAEFRDLVPVLISDSGTQALYAFRSKGGSGTVKTQNGGDYVLDTRALARAIQARR